MYDIGKEEAAQDELKDQELNMMRCEYKEGENGGIIPEIWIGHQGFQLTEKFDDPPRTAQEVAEWFFDMFKKALENYLQSRLQVTDEEIEKHEESFYKNYIDRKGPHQTIYKAAWKECLTHLKENKCAKKKKI